MKKGKAFEIETVRPGQTLYRIEPFFRVGLPQFTAETYVSHVVVSTAKTKCGSTETYVFAADESGNILCWIELYGCSSDMGHAAVLAALGVPLEGKGECDDCGAIGPISYSESGCDYCADCSVGHAVGRL